MIVIEPKSTQSHFTDLYVILCLCHLALLHPDFVISINAFVPSNHLTNNRLYLINILLPKRPITYQTVPYVGLLTVQFFILYFLYQPSALLSADDNHWSVFTYKHDRLLFSKYVWSHFNLKLFMWNINFPLMYF